jgi:hypothetical protein
MKSEAVADGRTVKHSDTFPICFELKAGGRKGCTRTWSLWVSLSPRRPAVTSQNATSGQRRRLAWALGHSADCMTEELGRLLGEDLSDQLVDLKTASIIEALGTFG